MEKVRIFISFDYKLFISIIGKLSSVQMRYFKENARRLLIANIPDKKVLAEALLEPYTFHHDMELREPNWSRNIVSHELAREFRSFCSVRKLFAKNQVKNVYRVAVSK